MTKRQKLIKLLGIIFLFLLHNYIMRVKGVDTLQSVFFFILYFIWFDVWNVYTERKREEVVG